MMQKNNKIFWRTGQEITPDTFKQADNYINSRFNLIHRLIADGNYGLLPVTDTDPTSFAIKTNLNNREITIEQLVCYGTTGAGYFVEMENNFLASLPRKYLSIPESGAKALYIVLRINPFEQVLVEPVTNGEAPEAHALYELDIRELDRIDEDELAILKIDNRSHTPFIDPDYVPPCMSVNACPKLLDTFNRIKQLLIEIMSHIRQKDYIGGTTIYPLAMLYDELEDFPLTGQPIVLLRLIKKIIRTFRFFITDIRSLDTPDLLRTYNHNDMSITYQSLLSYLQGVSKIVGQEKEDDFTPRI